MVGALATVVLGPGSPASGSSGAHHASSRVAGSPGWHQDHNPLGPGSDGLLAVSCATAQACVAAGGPIVSTTDGGASWTHGVLPGGFEEIDFVQCPSATVCVAGGDEPLSGSYGPPPPAVTMSSNGGLSWSPPIAIPILTYISGLDCTDVEHCWAWGPTGENPSYPAIVASTDGGK